MGVSTVFASTALYLLVCKVQGGRLVPRVHELGQGTRERRGRERSNGRGRPLIPVRMVIPPLHGGRPLGTAEPLCGGGTAAVSAAK